MTSTQTRLNPTRPLERHEILRLIKVAINQREYRFASQVSLDWLTEFPGDLNIKYWYGFARAKEGHLNLAASILDETLQYDPEYLDALKTRIEIEKQILNDNRKELPNYQISPSKNDLFEFQEWLIALSGETIGLPKRAYDDLALRWGEELHYLQKGFPNRNQQISSQTPDYEHSIQELIAAKADHPLVGIAHIRFLYQQYSDHLFPAQGLRNTIEQYLEKFPNCLYLNYVLVDCLMETNQPEKAVALLHSLAARDISAQVAKRVWQFDKSFFTIWPHTLFKQLEIPIPASVAAYLGLNQLPVGSIPQTTEPELEPPWIIPDQTISFASSVPQPTYATKQFISEETEKPSLTSVAEEFQESFNQISQHLKQPQLSNLDGRQPVYVILTANQPLQTSFGIDVQKQIEKSMLNFLQAIQYQLGWRGLLYYVDEGKSIPAANKSSTLSNAKPSDPCQIKQCLNDLDHKLASQGEMIGALMIVGGNEIIPFHRLPNPVEDGDDEILSDNPYGSRDDNYLALDWPVGRIPIPPQNAQFLIDYLDEITKAHQSLIQSQTNWKSKVPSFQWLFSWLSFLAALFDHRNPLPTSFGYTAAAWRFASFSVFREIGNPQNMLISPQNSTKTKPAQTAKQRLVRHTALQNKKLEMAGQTTQELSRTPAVQLPPAQSGYFNLHGLADSAEWFGQSDPTEAGFYNPSQSEHPVALQPGDILLNSSTAFKVVLSEACFGANINNKQIEDSIVLSFLDKGCQAFIGSTATAYGSNSTPLIAADFLAQAFWKNIRNGIPAGEALRQAKLALVAPVGKVEQTLDAEDQKTIISFTLLGDPLAQLGSDQLSPKVIRHAKAIQPVPKVICDRGMRSCQPDELSPQVETSIKKLVEKYLPGMEQANLSILSNGSECHGNCTICSWNCEIKNFAKKPTNQRAKSKEDLLVNRKIVIVKKENLWQNHIYTQYARMTLDSKGKLLKLAISK